MTRPKPSVAQEYVRAEVAKEMQSFYNAFPLNSTEPSNDPRVMQAVLDERERCARICLKIAAESSMPRVGQIAAELCARQIKG